MPDIKNRAQRELSRIRERLTIISPDTQEYDSLYVAQQALAWAIDPESAKAPFDMIMGTRGDLKDCLAEPRPPLSLDTCGHCA